jgi:hypothetical protein
MLQQLRRGGAVRQRLVTQFQPRLAEPDGVHREGAPDRAAVARMQAQGTPSLAQRAPEVTLPVEDPAELPVQLGDEKGIGVRPGGQRAEP